MAVAVSVRRPLGTKTKALVCLGVVLAVGLIGATALTFIGRHRRSRTVDRLETWSEMARKTWVPFFIDLLNSRHRDDPESFGVFYCCDHEGAYRLERPERSSPEDRVRDSWGNPIRFAFPGPVHRHGWDLYSVGPNGVDELGQGDDILVGEDVSAVSSGQR